MSRPGLLIGGGLACALVLLGLSEVRTQTEPPVPPQRTPAQPLPERPVLPQRTPTQPLPQRPVLPERTPTRPRSAPALWTASSILGASVQLKGGGASGKIVDLVLNENNTVEYVLVSFGDRSAFIPWRLATVDFTRRALVLDVSSEKFEQASFTQETRLDLTDPRSVEKVRTIFGVVERPTPVPSTPRQEPPRTPAPPPSRVSTDTPPAPEAVRLLRLKVRELIRRFDTERDGKLSWKEVSAALDHYDQNRDGFLDRNELAEAVRSLASSEDVKADQRVIAFLREYDVNKDGKLSRDEAKVLFDRADVNKDGLVDEEELVKAGERLLPAPTDTAPPHNTSR